MGSDTFDMAASSVLDFACGVDERYRRAPLSRIAFMYPLARAVIDASTITISPRGAVRRLPRTTISVQLAEVQSATVKLGRVWGYVRIAVEGSGVIFLMARTRDISDLVRWLGDRGVSVARRT